MNKVEAMHYKMLAIAIEVGLPKFYQDDLLVHDLYSLSELDNNEESEFYWRLRECGTQFSTSEHMARYGWDNEQEYCYHGNLKTGELTKLPLPSKYRTKTAQ